MSGEQWVLTLAEARALRRGLGPVLRAARILDKAGSPVHFILPMGGAPRLVQGVAIPKAGAVGKSEAAVDLRLGADWLRETRDSMAMFVERVGEVGEVGAAPVLSTRPHQAARDFFAAPISAEDFAAMTAPDGDEVGEGDAPLILIEDEIPAGPSGTDVGLAGGGLTAVPAVAASHTEGPETGAKTGTRDAPTPAPVAGEAGTVAAGAEGGGTMRPPSDVAPAAAPSAPVSRPQSGAMWTAEEDARLIGLVSEAMARGDSRRSAGQKAAKILQRGAPGIDYRLTQILAGRLEAAVGKVRAQGVQPVTLVPPAPPAVSAPVAEAEVAAVQPVPVKPVPVRAEAPRAATPVAARPARAMPPVDACKSSKARILREALNSRGYRDGWSADLDFAVFEGLALSQKVPQIAVNLGRDAEDVKSRIAQLNQAAMVACGVDRVTIDSGRLLAEEIRDRAAWFRARASDAA